MKSWLVNKGSYKAFWESHYNEIILTQPSPKLPKQAIIGHIFYQDIISMDILFVENSCPRDPGPPKLRMVMEPKYCAEEVIGHANHHLRIWLDS